MAKKKTEQKKWPEKWHELNPGCMVFAAGNAANYKTGSWKSQHPVWDNSKCIKCGICYIFCPEGCIQETQDGFYEANLDYCKGCGICAHECWPGAIVMREEEE
ncbi:MAG: Pyruvate synthase subunit PorD [Syntrophaceae bacterium PtaU1.Bin231]|jgi:pyruvate ferredoxin oxidoreductase delta subunit|nr:MAG: Pyruvate synthase subunit PorD [Syntrophaceae bacterium PtaB.Bin038]OPY93354.1 MAG: Pyruvate synthase subunit PorD [Syntrophaceae bacterium PtaU1.Bin231]